MIPQEFVDRMPFMVKPDNIANYKDGLVSILDRRVYPFEVEFVVCKNYREVAVAIEEMVTQSLGPAYAAGYGMASAARDCKNEEYSKIIVYMNIAATRIINTRPTNHEIRDTVNAMLAYLIEALAKGQRDPEEIMLDFMEKMIDRRHEASLLLGRQGALVLKDGDTILTHCWPETTLIYTLMEAISQGKSLKAYTGETRPYLQGARLTAAALKDLGIPVTVITDNMPGFLLSQGKIDVFFAGSDRTTMDGHVINKVGTLQIAICAKEYGVPFYAFAYGPDPQALTPDHVVIEERNPEEVLSLRGIPTAAPGVDGYYPAFDITPPKFITGIITDRGIFPPDKIRDYFL
jgi:methylthioribose-1-phosphate isomerase